MALMAFVMVHDRVPRESPWGESQICRAGPPPAAGGEAVAPSTHVPRGAGPGPPPLPAGIQQGGAYTWNSRLTHAAPLLAQSQPPVAAGGTGSRGLGFARCGCPRPCSGTCSAVFAPPGDVDELFRLVPFTLGVSEKEASTSAPVTGV